LPIVPAPTTPTRATFMNFLRREIPKVYHPTEIQVFLVFLANTRVLCG
jgi:hypothetical protein